jgi:hypothetical protein
MVSSWGEAAAGGGGGGGAAAWAGAGATAPAAEDQEDEEVVVDQADARAQTLAREAQYRRQQLDRATLEQSHDAAEPR